jgi:2-methylcitrate dehydratase PrpD
VNDPTESPTPGRNIAGRFTRRDLLRGAGCLIAATALTPSVGRAQNAAAGKPSENSDDTVMAKLSAYLSEAAARELPADVQGVTQHHILDTIAAMVSGIDLPPGKAALRFARAQAGDQVATIVGSRETCGPVEAALVNGMLAHSDETDGVHALSRSHPGAGVVPAAWSAGEQFGIGGTTLMRAVALGFDIGTRVVLTLGDGYVKMLNHRSPQQVVVTFGAAAAAACAAGLTAQQMRWVMDFAAQQAGGTTAWQRDTQHIQKSLCLGGFGARDGVTTALLISAGATGVDDIFSGTDNFFLAYAPEADPAGLVDQLGQRYEIMRTNLKKWTVGAPIQAPLDALQNLMQRRPFEPDQVRTMVVRVGTVGAKIVSNREMADICLQHLVAVMLLDKTVSFQAAHDKPRMQDPNVLRQRAKVQLIPDDDLQRFYPATPAIVEVTLTDGTVLTERSNAVRGTAENPMTREEVVAKGRELMEPRLGADKCARLIEALLNLERVQDIRTLRPLLQPS